MGKLFKQATAQPTLYAAWRRIRANGYNSSNEETRAAVEEFDKKAPSKIISLQKALRNETFEFAPQIGITKKKGSGGKRGIVLASVENRIVERAILDVLQAKCPFVKDVIETPTSMGGVPERSVPHALRIIDAQIRSGARYFLRSDVSGFFDGIPRKDVIEKISQHVDDHKFILLLDRATMVTLKNEEQLGEDRKVFPTTEEGVAQGSPLSPLFGNILLNNFDGQFNSDGIVCVRFIDDFVMLSKDNWRLKRAFDKAEEHLKSLGLTCHSPFNPSDRRKSEHGPVENGITFLGYSILPGLIQPSPAARSELQKNVRSRIRDAKRNIESIQRGRHSVNSLRYSQTLVGIDRVICGWGNAFAYTTVPSTLDDLDQQIDSELKHFRSWYRNLIRNHDWRAQRRTGGVGLLTDIKRKSLAEVPFKIEPGKRFRRSPKATTASTDGSVYRAKRLARDRGPGGWAFVIHEGNKEGSGAEINVTNNQMELRAVLEVLKATPADVPLRIRTDSQYVAGIANGGNVVKSNPELWREYQSLVAGRTVKVEWIKGHTGDPHNERVDTLAKQKALGLHLSTSANAPKGTASPEAAARSDGHYAPTDS